MKTTLLKIITVSAILQAALLIATSTAAMAAPAGQSKGGVYLESSFAPIFSQTNNESRGPDTLGAPSVNPETTLGADLRSTLGYTLWGKVLVGGSFNYSAIPKKRDVVNETGASESMDDKITKLEGGPTLGFFLGNFRIMGTAMFLGKRVIKNSAVDSGGTTVIDARYDQKLGFGYQVQLGYSFNVGKRFKIGPTLAYRHVKYTKSSLTDNVTPGNSHGEQDLGTAQIESNFEPMITMAIQF